MSVAQNFEQVHHDGAARFGVDWLTINQEIVDSAWGHGLDPSREPLRTYLSMLSYRWLEDVESVRKGDRV